MALFCVLLHVVNLLWCIVMPLVGTLHLISPMFKEENRGKWQLMRHWCHYWIAFTACHLIFSFLEFLPTKLMTFLQIVRLLLLGAMATPALPVTSKVFEFLHSSGSSIISFKDWIYNWVLELLGVKEKTA